MGWGCDAGRLLAVGMTAPAAQEKEEMRTGGLNFSGRVGWKMFI